MIAYDRTRISVDFAETTTLIRQSLLVVTGVPRSVPRNLAMMILRRRAQAEGTKRSGRDIAGKTCRPEGGYLALM